MFRIFCCRSRRSSRVDIDRITDSLEACLSNKLGVSEFGTFLKIHNLREARTLEFVLKCESILNEINKLSPETRARALPPHIQTAISALYGMKNDINFTSSQIDSLENLNSDDTDRKIEILRDSQDWAKDLLRDIYNTFRRKLLEKYR